MRKKLKPVAWTNQQELDDMNDGSGYLGQIWNFRDDDDDDEQVALFTAAQMQQVRLLALKEAAPRTDVEKDAALTDLQVTAVRDAVAEALGDAYDCTRVWAAWGYNTMTQDDFSLIAEDTDRIAEIADAAISAILAAKKVT